MTYHTVTSVFYHAKVVLTTMYFDPYPQNFPATICSILLTTISLWQSTSDSVIPACHMCVNVSYDIVTSVLSPSDDVWLLLRLFHVCDGLVDTAVSLTWIESRSFVIFRLISPTRFLIIVAANITVTDSKH